MNSKGVFLVYSSEEEDFAAALKELIERWFPGLQAFYFQQIDRESGADYRLDVGYKLASSAVVILLLSRGFRWSQYCQSEAGAAAALEATVPETDRLHQIPVLISVDKEEDTIAKICPALRTAHKIDAGDPRTSRKPHEFISLLKGQLTKYLCANPKEQGAGLNELIETVETQLQLVIDHYLMTPARIEISKIWSSIDERNTLASDSIVKNIKRSLRETEHDTKITLVGVSLKYSIRLVERALREFSEEYEPEARKKEKKLKIKLVHMDDNSNVLYALHDEADIRSIREVLLAEERLREQWRGYCEKVSISLKKPKRIGIDYIPPRIGILIDDNILYGGRCAFEHAGIQYRLLVGEREYFYHTDSDERGRKMIQEFKLFLEVYEEPSLNGIELVESRDEWLSRLEHCIRSRPEIKEVTLISQTHSRFRDLAGNILRKGIHLKIYVQRPSESQPPGVRDEIEKIEAKIFQQPFLPATAKAEIYYFDELPTFRAALLGDEMLGIQMYVPADPAGGADRGTSPVRIIATKYSPRFAMLRDELIGDFLNRAPREPFKVVRPRSFRDAHLLRE